MNTITCAIVAIAITLATGLAGGRDPVDHGASRTAQDIPFVAPFAARDLLRI